MSPSSPPLLSSPDVWGEKAPEIFKRIGAENRRAVLRSMDIEDR